MTRAAQRSFIVYALPRWRELNRLLSLTLLLHWIAHFAGGSHHPVVSSSFRVTIR